ncbi:anti-sigma factor [Microbacterium sp. ET2]|uniref:anti-sigma factor n=1 Tax=Microbacterium albipurpureum TaxID=3050384 RepID=UPI00259CB8C9|nr:anti-sigma factor [Microbacterium sp. ET2 (Ac-2212)]WJL95844.1 anti-sigma factor [Microbacterium sp. ET2 (Ac-2212)]
MPHLESHLDPEVLTLLAIGESVATPAEQDHLSTCPRCKAELSALTRTVVAGRSTVLLEDLEAPPDRVWSRISEELGFSTPAMTSGATAVSEIGPAVQTRPTNPSDAGADRSRAGSDAAPAHRRRRRGLIRGLFVLAASVAVVGVAVGGWALTRQATVVELASAELAAFPDHPGAEGSAVVVERGDETVIEVALDADVDPDSNREVWLITEDASEIISLGMLEGQTGEFVVPDTIDLREFVLVDVSDEPVDGDPTHSGDSIVRGALDFA